jgi:hypothetical protein
MVHNVPPVVEEMNSMQPDFEDEMVDITGVAHDTDELTECWDLDLEVDSDGKEGLDCDVLGAHLQYVWYEAGEYTIAFHATDDDGASANTTVIIRRINAPPKASISLVGGVLEIEEGESLTFSALNSTDTPSDLLELHYSWDAENVDSDEDGRGLGDVDGQGKSFTLQFKEPGEWAIILTVTDDDGASDSMEYVIKVNARPEEGYISSLDTGTGVTLGMAILVGFLLVVYLFIRREPSEEKTDIAYIEQQNSLLAPAMPVMPEVNAGPAIPAGGIPVGWTMEQWQHYGQQYLDSLGAQPTPVQQSPVYEQEVLQQQPVYSTEPIQPQPMTYHSGPVHTDQDLSDLLGDLGL